MVAAFMLLTGRGLPLKIILLNIVITVDKKNDLSRWTLFFILWMLIIILFNLFYLKLNTVDIFWFTLLIKKMKEILHLFP
jgi:hypothetical protein